METLARTLDNWSSEIACVWRFTKNNGITEGFHTKMEVIQRALPQRRGQGRSLTAKIAVG
jgi:hypothetical protein